MTRTIAFVALFVLASPACQPAPATVAPASPPTTEPVAKAPAAEATSDAIDDARGGRLFDRWYGELELEFSPGSAGGPNANGTLVGASGATIDHEGHGYRLKGFFGWDLRGTEGIYGPAYQNKPYVLSVNLLDDRRSTDELAAWLTAGDEHLPAFGAVLSPKEIGEVVAFIDGVRTGRLPSPAQIFELSKTAPKNYTLRDGGDARRGAAAYANTCADCHGADGREIPIDDEYSVGAYMRQNAHEAWFKILNGQPGTAMHREIEFASGAEGAAQILDLLAAGCDRTALPPLEGKPDVPDGDARCGSYLR